MSPRRPSRGSPPPAPETPAAESATAARPWEVRVGYPPLVVHAFERPERKGVVFARWTDPAREARDRRRKLSLDVRVRGDDGRLDPALVAAAEAKVRALYTALIAGRSPAAAAGPPGGDVAGWAAGWVPGAGPLPLAAGFALALRLDGAGMYAEDSRRRQDVRRAADAAMRVLGRDTPWADLTPSRTAALWRALARRHAETGRGGPRDAEVVAATLYAVAQWLRDNEHLPADACRPPKGWRARLKADWEQLTGAAVVVARPRHTAAEMRAIFTALPGADPRIRLAVELGAELRLGQVLRATRRDLDLSPRPEHPGGAVHVRGRGRKRGELVVLTAEQRAAVDASLAGHLREFEAAFQGGSVDDYPLFPGGKLADGVARFRHPPRAFNRRTALDLFHALETAAGVTPIPGRGWYGLRRQATDLAPQYTSDDRVLDRVGGHQRDTRERIYQDRHDLRLAREAAAVRRALRGHDDPGGSRKDDSPDTQRGTSDGEPIKSSGTTASRSREQQHHQAPPDVLPAAPMDRSKPPA